MKRTKPATLVSVLLLFGCAPSQVVEAKVDLTKEYSAIKQLILKRTTEPDVEECARLVTRVTCAEEIGRKDDSDEPLIVFDCGFTDGVDGFFEGDTNQSDWSLHLLEVAKLAVALELAAPDAGYPDASWKPALQRYEGRELAAALKIYQEESKTGVKAKPAGATSEQSNADEEMAEADDEAGNGESDPAHPYNIVDVDLKSYRESVDPSLPALQSIDGCGAGESPMVVNTEPRARRIQLIPGFFSTLCKNTGRSLEGDDCPYWFDVTPGKELGLAGYYRYAVTWADGTRTVGAVDVDRLASEDGTAELMILGHDQ